MPTVTISLSDLTSLLGRELSLEELESSLFLHKCLVERVEGDELSIEVNADRPDMLSAEGIARALKLFMGLERPRKYEAAEGDVVVRVDPSVLKVRPFILCALIRDVKLSDEAVRQLMLLQEKLHSTYCRNRAKASIGLHDMDAVGHELIYTALPPREIRFTPLGEVEEMSGDEVLERVEKGREYAFLLKGLDRYPLLRDSEGRVLSMPPIINGSLTKVTPSTRNLFIDVTGVDFETVSRALNIVALNAAERGGFLEKVEVVYPDRLLTSPLLDASSIRLELSLINGLLGLNLSMKEVVASLEKMGYVATSSEDVVEAQPPPYRCDILHPVDVVEDVAIGYGYDKIAPIRPPRTQMGSLLNVTRLIERVRDVMIGLGFQEVVSYTLTSPEALSRNMLLERVDAVTLENPISHDYSCLRTWLIPILLSFLSYNRHVELPQKIFECGDVVLLDPLSSTSTRVEKRLAAAICDRKVGYEDIQAYLYALLHNLGLQAWSIKPLNHPSFIEGRGASLVVEDAEVAMLGEIHPAVLARFELQNPTACFELSLTKLLELI